MEEATRIAPFITSPRRSQFVGQYELGKTIGSGLQEQLEYTSILQKNYFQTYFSLLSDMLSFRHAKLAPQPWK